ncbi:MAG: hypothetical protein JSU01_21895 [Bacteroidetes bacterium]|nr:hypothetical protein [Bacteroidota bacterium]
MDNSKTFAGNYPSDRNFVLLLMVITWAAIISGFGYDIAQRSIHGTLHFPAIVHIHAVAFVGWLVLFTTQVLLVRINNLALHKKLGLISFGLIPAMVILGTAAAIVSQRVEWGTPDSDLHFTVVQFGDMLMFGCVAGTGIYLRERNNVAHKRLMLVATLILTDAGFGRWLMIKATPLFGDDFFKYTTLSEGFWRFWAYEVPPTLILILALGVYDLVTRKQLNKVYAWAVGFYVLVTAAEGWLYYNGTWFTMMKHLIGVQ